MTGLVLVVDDRREVRELLAEELVEVGLRVVQAGDGVQGWACYRRAEPDLVVTDLRMPRADGLDLLRRIREVASTPVIVLTAYGDPATSALALRSGAEDFMTFPDDLDRVIDRGRLLASRDDSGLGPADWLAGSSSAIRRVREQVAWLAPASSPVLVSGECDRGRAAVVAELHGRGAFSKLPIVRVDAAAQGHDLPQTGFVHLEGVERMDASDQARWIAWLASATEAGDRSGRRVVASSAADPGALAGRLDPRLASLLCRDAIEVPSLRSRIDDLRELVPALVRRLARARGFPDSRVPAPLVTALRSHAWPGNLDELVRVLEHAIQHAGSGAITLEGVESALLDPAAGACRLADEHRKRQREEIARLYEACNGNLAEMARQLGVSRGSVVYRMQKLGIPVRPNGTV